MLFLGKESTIPALPATWWSPCVKSGFKTLAWIRSENCHVLQESSVQQVPCLLHSASCRHVCLFIPLFWKKQKKRPQENPIWLKHGIGTKCFSSWEKHFLHSFVQIHSSTQAIRSLTARSVGRAEPWAGLWWPAAPLRDGSFREDRKHTQWLTESLGTFLLYTRRQNTTKKGLMNHLKPQSWTKHVSHFNNNKNAKV